jgi:hypothetical protein
MLSFLACAGLCVFIAILSSLPLLTAAQAEPDVYFVSTAPFECLDAVYVDYAGNIYCVVFPPPHSPAVIAIMVNSSGHLQQTFELTADLAAVNYHGDGNYMAVDSMGCLYTFMSPTGQGNLLVKFNALGEQVTFVGYAPLAQGSMYGIPYLYQAEIRGMIVDNAGHLFISYSNGSNVLAMLNATDGTA